MYRHNIYIVNSIFMELHGFKYMILIVQLISGMFNNTGRDIKISGNNIKLMICMESNFLTTLL